MDRTEFLSSVGKRIAKARKSARISQAELAELTDLSVSCISKIERGINNFSAESLSKIAIALDTSSSRLLNEFFEENIVPLHKEIEKSLEGYSREEIDGIIQIVNIINKIKNAKKTSGMYVRSGYTSRFIFANQYYCTTTRLIGSFNFWFLNLKYLCGIKLPVSKV